MRPFLRARKQVLTLYNTPDKLIVRKTVINLEPETITFTCITSFTAVRLKYLHLRSFHSQSMQDFLNPQISNVGKIIMFLIGILRLLA